MPAFVSRSPAGGWLNPNLSESFDNFSGITGWPAGASAQGASPYGARAASFPVASHDPARTGMTVRSFSGDFYHRIHARPISLPVGIVGADRVITGLVWNAYLEAKVLTAIDTDDGITVYGLSAPATVQGLREVPITITIRAEVGPTDINTDLAFIFTAASGNAIEIRGKRGVPWAFLPRSELIESCEWLTDVSQSYETESRAAIRETPIREFQLTHVVTADLQQYARKLARSARTILVPDWPRKIVADAYTGAPADLPDGPVLIWRSPTDYSQTTVSGGVLGDVDMPESDAVLLPLLACRLLDGWSNTRPAGQWAEMSLTVQTADGPDESDAGLYPLTLDGLPVVTDCPVVGSGSADEGVTFEFNTVDNGLGLPTDDLAGEFPAQRYTARWYKKGAAYEALRGWIYSRKGKYLPFWLPSWANDLPGAVKSGSGLSSPTFDDDEGALLIVIGGSYYPRTVVSAVETAGVWAIQLNASIPDGTITRCMYLRRVRFSADRIEFRHAAAEAVAVAVQCVEVPE